MRIVSVVGGRPNLLQLAPVARALAQVPDVEPVIIHTGRHDAPGMAAALRELSLPPIAYHLEVGAGSGGVQTGLMLQRLEPALGALQPDVVLGYGDDRSAAAAAIASATLGIRFGHIEAGLRSEAGAGKTLPSRIADSVADLEFVPSRDAIDVLKGEGVAEERIQFVGSVRIDALCWALSRAPVPDSEPYAVTSLHEPGTEVVEAIAELDRRLPVVPAPESYVERMGLVAGAALVVTDADDLQDETSYLGIPCLTVRANTDHLASCQHGTNRLVAPSRATLLAAADRALSRRAPVRPVLERWDGRAAERIAGVLCEGAEFPAEAVRRGRRAVAMPQMA